MKPNKREITVGVGIRVGEIYKALEKHNLLLVGGEFCFKSFPFFKSLYCSWALIELQNLCYILATVIRLKYCLK